MSGNSGADPEYNLTLAKLNPGHAPHGTFYKLRLLKTQFEQFRYVLVSCFFNFAGWPRTRIHTEYIVISSSKELSQWPS